MRFLSGEARGRRKREQDTNRQPVEVGLARAVAASVGEPLMLSTDEITESRRR
jgi:hypothetical protein